MNSYPMLRISTVRIIVEFIGAAVVFVVLQGILSIKFRIFGYFDLPLIASVYYGFTFSNPIASVVFGSVMGLMQDSLSGVALGINGLSKTLIGFFAAKAGAKFAIDQTVARVFALFLFTLGDGILVSI